MAKDFCEILLKRNLVSLPESNKDTFSPSIQELGTIINNFAHYGYMPNKFLFKFIQNPHCDQTTFLNWYNEIVSVMKNITSDDENIAEHIVYKNFPKEVLNMSESEYYLCQVCVYLGLGYDFVREKEEKRVKIDPLFSELKVIHVADENTIDDIALSLVNSNSSWSVDQINDALKLKLYENFPIESFAFKSNGINLFAQIFDYYKPDEIKDATNVLRLSLALSEIDNNNDRLFRSFKRPERKYFLSLLEKTKNLEEDILLNKKEWKKFLHLLHPNEYKFNRVRKAFDDLCKNKNNGYNSKLEKAIQERNKTEVFHLLSKRAGVFSNRLHEVYNIFGLETFKSFSLVLEKIDTKKLLKIKNYFSRVNNKKTGIVFSNKGKRVLFHKIELKEHGHYENELNRNVLIENKEVVDNTITTEKVKVKVSDLNFLISAIDKEIKRRMLILTGQRKLNVSDDLSKVKFKLNQNENINFGSGTVFDIPENINFIRTATYWRKVGSTSSFWLDNSVNLFSDKFSPLGACCWNSNTKKYGCVFSGDPVLDENNRAGAQLIDINIEKALNSGARYAVLSALSYNSINFYEFEDGQVMVQFLDDAQKGELFEPSRVNVNFDLSESSSKDNVCVVFDLAERKLIFVNYSLKLNVRSAINNKEILSKFLKFELDNILNNPSMLDLLSTVHDPDSDMYALYSDKDVDLPKDIKHFVFKKENDNNQNDFYQIEDFV